MKPNLAKDVESLQFKSKISRDSSAQERSFSVGNAGFVIHPLSLGQMRVLVWSMMDLTWNSQTTSKLDNTSETAIYSHPVRNRQPPARLDNSWS